MKCHSLEYIQKTASLNGMLNIQCYNASQGNFMNLLYALIKTIVTLSLQLIVNLVTRAMNCSRFIFIICEKNS